MLQRLLGQRPAISYVAPFIVFVGLMGVERSFDLPAAYFYPLRFALTVATLVLVSGRLLTLRPGAPFASLLLGAAVFLIWVAPDQLFGYRHFWLFENPLMGRAASSLPVRMQGHPGFLALRAFSSFALVPVVEELFWRGWLMRWIIHHEFLSIPVGKYAPFAFWITALLFASEHGPYWEVGLAAGVAYNWWAVRRHNLADCVLAHTATNALLAAWVLLTGQWHYWL